MPLFLQLFHGRLEPDQEMNDWGSVGPTLGPLEAVNTTYGSIRLILADREVDLPFVNGLIHYDGVLYGDTSTFIDDEAVDAVLPDDAAAAIRERDWSDRPESPSVSVPRERLQDYLQSVSVFRDILLDLGGDALADAGVRALRRVIRR